MTELNPQISHTGGTMDRIGDFLRAGGHRDTTWSHIPRITPFALILICGGIYGAVMGTYYGLHGDRILMIAFSSLKVPMLFFVTMLTAVPCFYVLNLLFGVGDDFSRVWSGLIDYQMSVALQLAALTPVTLIVNLSYGEYRSAQLWNTLMFGIAAWNAQRSLRVCYKPLIEKNKIHVWLRRFWLVLYAFLGIQMAWVLRPFIGHPDMKVTFFRDHIGNAYVEVAKVLVRIYQKLWIGF